MASTSPPSSLGDLDKDVELGKERKPELTQQQQDLLEASEPPFTEHVSPSDPNNNDNDPDGGQLEKVSSAKPSLTNIRFVPNGGLLAWLQVLGSFFIYFNAWGIVNTFGTYQTYYETALLSSSSPSQISWIGSVQAFLLMVVSALGGPLYDAGYVHHLLIGGSVLAVLGQFMLSLCSTYWQVFLAQGVCIGVGTGAMFVPGVAILSTYFSTKIATATGLAAAGSSLGGTIYPIVFRQLQPRIGFPWATRVLGFMMLATLVVSNCVLKVRVLPEGRRRFLDLSAFREAPYLFFVAGNMLAFLGLYNPFFYVPSYVIESGIAGPDLAFYMLSIINAASTFGRIIPGYTADRIGPLNMIVPCTFFAGVLCICLAAAHSIGPVIAILVFYGFCSGTLVSLPPTIFVHLTQNRAVIGTRMGMGFAITSLGMLVGTPISGAILNKSSFTWVWVFGGVCTVAGSLCLLGARVTKGGVGLMTKV
ncbi:hypothetical protein LTR91_008886 [Friedmanniomyces endolithicus]|uniref:Major facilitator superfamily (MFS) profile domain-containing protein n=1 Tax=Friedmanniomyces endolithicus TaxID=329885 RepID=A0AAN6KNQ4_9PEZI|nr:hypothetical protein LTS02_011820 [Friedmanniomyces endolithicus]KAK0884358.1 hypothetical protein LTR87_001989 [Friedmanniomyces endolithicus]KAK0909691.1 hypothetical protein LTR57_016237 [Friedmanniomyces endolithicus]KAK0968579.1 hypothetical protein LTS01_016648 [Friedmanniomyces endolithicus]KAK0990573.1 hypothetical protein LTR91_008886 [Friedmanniomyces endolithicus]